jgi:hypothetical protein
MVFYDTKINGKSLLITPACDQHATANDGTLLSPFPPMHTTATRFMRRGATRARGGGGRGVEGGAKLASQQRVARSFHPSQRRVRAGEAQEP